MKKLITICAVIVVLLFSSAYAMANPWQTLDYPGAPYTNADGLDGSNIVGEYKNDANGPEHGFLYNNGTWKDIDMPGATSTEAHCIDGNNIAGWYSSEDCNDCGHGFLYNGTTWTTLDAPGATFTSADGIDGSNIVGCYYDASGNEHSFLYNGSSWTTLDMPVADYTEACGISGSNIVGNYWVNDGSYGYGFLYNGTTWTILNMPGATGTEAHGIEGSNIVGCYYDASGNEHSFLYDGTSWKTIDMPGATVTSVCGISGSNIVGEYADASGNEHGFIYMLLTGDFNFDGMVNFKDLAILADHWLESDCQTSNDCKGADLNLSDTVDFADLAIFTSQWLTGTPPEAGTGTHTASGTYTWDSNSTFVLTTTTSDFICNGPELGAQTMTGVTVTATTMTWPNDGMTWTRPIGTAGDIVGTWVSTDTTGAYTLTLNANNTVSLVGVIVQCNNDNGGDNNVKAEAQHWPDDYHVSLRYIDPNRTATSVSVAGPGITGSVALTYNTHGPTWGSGTPESIISFGATYPDGLPFTYTFTITDANGTWTATSTVSCFQEQFVANISPTGSVTGTPTFSWTGIDDPSPVYGVEVSDSNGNWLWDTNFISGTSIVYNGPALTPGMTYSYVVSVQSSSACSNPTSGGGSCVTGSFTYQ